MPLIIQLLLETTDKTTPVSPGDRRAISRKLAVLLIPLALLAADGEWPVNGGPYNIRYSTLSQITPANVGKLKV
ncbi:MAG TPA: hypothetical protein VGS58_20045, partial [Candidatus Sulfopaludibacter sp.]|nr:hypothetical protein [Candidatus Sulfopaludibacter sp.]